MSILTATMFLSLDGVIQAPGLPDEDRSGGFELGGWQVPYFDEDLMRLAAERFAQADAFLLGRRTYETFAAYWPNVEDPTDPIATPLNRLPKYVASRTLDTVHWHNSTLLAGDVVEAVAALKRRPGREIQVHGSAALLQTLMRHNLVDEYLLWIYPVVLGGGKRLFPEGCAPGAMKLIDSRTTGSGAVALTYRPAGPVEVGSVA